MLSNISFFMPKIAISHWQGQSPITQGWRYRAAHDIYLLTYLLTYLGLLIVYCVCMIKSDCAVRRRVGITRLARVRWLSKRRWRGTHCCSEYTRQSADSRQSVCSSRNRPRNHSDSAHNVSLCSIRVFRYVSSKEQLRFVHSAWAELTWTEAATGRPSYTTWSLVMRVSVTTWLAAANLGRLVLSQFWTHIPMRLFTLEFAK